MNARTVNKFRVTDPKVIQEGILFGWRTDGPSPRVSMPGQVGPQRLGLYFTEDQAKVISLAIGDLHLYGGTDYELYVFDWNGDGPDDICCHSTLELAEACAVQAFVTGKWCSE